MKITYIGIDLLFPAWETVASAGMEIMAIYSCRNEPHDKIEAFAAENKIPLTFERIRKTDVERLVSQGCELFLSAGYNYLIPVTAAVPMLNVHPTLLPKGRGGWPLPWLILRGDSTGGVTVHRLASGFDTGDIVAQSSFPLDPETETLESYLQKVYEAIPPLLTDLLNDLDGHLANAFPQGEGEYLPIPDKSASTVNASMTVGEADRLCRAFYGDDVYYRAPDGAETALLYPRAAKTPPDGASETFPLADGVLYVKKT